MLINSRQNEIILAEIMEDFAYYEYGIIYSDVHEIRYGIPYVIIH
jgi:hypothetical protein